MIKRSGLCACTPDGCTKPDCVLDEQMGLDELRAAWRKGVEEV